VSSDAAPATDAAEVLTGACLCGIVRFQVVGPISGTDACHCVQCRKHSGHFFASCDAPRTALTIEGEEHIAWYASSARVRRGFCARCGSTLFWDPIERDWIAIAMGAFDAPTGLRLHRHIFVAEQGDYYDIADGLPQSPRWPRRP
jgi:hypothetical protein